MDDHDDRYSSSGKSPNKDPSLLSASTKNKKTSSLTPPSPSSHTSSTADAAALEAFLKIPLGELLVSTNMGVLITDEDDYLIWVNEMLFRQYSVINTTDFIIGRHATEVMHYMQEFVAHPRTFRQRIRGLMENRKAFYGEQFPLADGRIMWMDYVPVFHEGKFRGAIWQLVDYSRRMESMREKQAITEVSFPAMLDKFHIIYCEIDMQGTIQQTSPFFSKFSGYPEEELLKTNFLDLCRSGKKQMIDCLQHQRPTMMTRAVYNFELEIALRSGVHKWMQCHVTFREDNARDSCTMLLTEITEQKSIQQELEDAKKLAEHAQMAQQQFLANMSHDIRTPLNAIIGMTFLLEDTPLASEQHEYVKVLKNASNILLGLLNGVLDFAKIASGKQEIRQREFDLPDLLRSLVETFSFKVNDKPVKVHYSIDRGIDHLLLGDDILVNQILMNLLSNAEKFTAKGEINLDVTITKEYENNIWIEFRVADTGIGISKEKLKEIFQDFTQADDDIRINYGGSGLGLFICKKLVEMLGGQIAVESTQGKGTTFIFSLPFVVTGRPLKKQVSDTSFRPLHTENVRILVVEDNAMNLTYLSSLLHKYQVPFDVATDGKIALKKAQESYYNLILMDMKLPKMSGMDVAAFIRDKDTLNTATPIVLVSAAAFQSTVDKAREVGVNELLAKPYTPDQLVNILRKYLVDEEEDPAPDTVFQDPGDAFRFDERLDIAYLRKLYAGNCSYAMSLFEVFLECMEKDWEEIQQARDAEDWVMLRNLVHKVKPNFSMVGLTWITTMMQNIYEKLKTESPHEALPLLVQAERQYDEYIPLVKSEYHRMQMFLDTEMAG
jgi:PAS domain S-box-containing protein